MLLVKKERNTLQCIYHLYKQLQTINYTYVIQDNVNITHHQQTFDKFEMQYLLKKERIDAVYIHFSNIMTLISLVMSQTFSSLTYIQCNFITILSANDLIRSWQCFIYMQMRYHTSSNPSKRLSELNRQKCLRVMCRGDFYFYFICFSIKLEVYKYFQS